MYREYTKAAQRLETKGGGNKQQNPYPYLEPSHSKKLIREEGFKTINTLTQDQRLHTKEYFSLWSENSSFPKANKFLSFQTNQNIHKGAICQAFLQVFTTKAPCQPRRVSFTEPKRTQTTVFFPCEFIWLKTRTPTSSEFRSLSITKLLLVYLGM